MTYFTNCRTIEEAKALYKDLVKRKSEDCSKYHRHEMELDEIKTRYGCHRFETIKQTRLAH